MRLRGKRVEEESEGLKKRELELEVELKRKWRVLRDLVGLSLGGLLQL